MKNFRSVIEDGMRLMIDTLNRDVLLSNASVRFVRQVDHFVDRLIERDIDIRDTLSLITQTVKEHKCELIYFCYRDDAPIRLHLQNRKLIVGLTLHQTDDGVRHLKFRTIIPNFVGRRDSRVSTYIIGVSGKSCGFWV